MQFVKFTITFDVEVADDINLNKERLTRLVNMIDDRSRYLGFSGNRFYEVLQDTIKVKARKSWF